MGLWLAFVLLLMMSSCKTGRQTTQKDLSRKDVERILNMQISRHDNERLYREAAYWLRTPHRDGGNSRSGIDCSFLTYIIYRNVYNKQIERNSQDILKKNCRKISRSRLQEGDLVFFDTIGGSKVSHVGVYLKEGKFVHASTSKGVMISNLDEEYYRRHWVCGGRVE
jgi:cell wall-associated NlpC family hydrolase